MFTPYEAVIREAITTISPFYRLLCAYRLYESLKPLRADIRRACKHFGVDAPLPKVRPVDVNWLRKLGFMESFLIGLRNVEDFWKKLGEMRNGVAHFLLDGSGAVSFSDGGMYHLYSLSAAALLHYSHESFRDLYKFVTDNLDSVLLRGSILPLPEIRTRFIIRPDQP